MNPFRFHRFGLALCIVPAGLLAACAASDSIGDAEVDPIEESVDADTVDEDSSGGAAAGAPDDGVSDAELNADNASISFASDVAPIVERTCASCHTGTGPGTQHIVMDTAGMVAAASGAMELVIESGYMPPWPASDKSVAFKHDWSLTDDERAVILGWHAEGAPLDVEPVSPIEPSDRRTVIDDPDIVVDPIGTYDGELGQPDEYRCFIYDPAVNERSFVRSMEFRPDQEMVVHHAVGSVVDAGERATVEAVAAAEDDGQGGWTCFGFQPAPSAEIVLGWAPGQAATVYPEGSGLLMEPGDFFVIQVHYHYEVEAPADRSQLAIEWVPKDEVSATAPIDVGVYLAPAEIPCSADETGPLCDRITARDAAVAKYGPGGVLADSLVAACGYSVDDFAGMTDGIANAECTQSVNTQGTILSVFGHQHEIGKSFQMTLNPGRADERVLLDIPRWDFDWQMLYEPEEQIEIRPGDEIKIECSWDRSLRKPTLEPAYVLWADGTDDEMCFATVTTVSA